MMKIYTRILGFVILYLGITTCAFAQNNSVKVDPPHWWEGFENDSLFLLIKGSDLNINAVEIKQDGLELLSYSATTKYLFLYLKVKQAGDYTIEIKNGKKKLKVPYTIKERTEQSAIQGLSQKDFIYLLMPDRFANGDPNNDSFKHMNQTSVHRDSLFERHGGDIQGVIDHLDYLQELGVTALWLNPVEENDQPEESYHGYAITDHYSVDPRIGTNDSYKNLSIEADKRGIKMVRDVIFNHFGNEHYLIKDLPDSSWIHTWNTYTKTSYRATTRLDPYVSNNDLDRFERGWFDHHMPDMNYNNKDLQRYMIQNSIWWVEEFSIDSYRIDTYIYPQQKFMRRWAKELKTEYPELFLFAETWVHGSVIQAWFAGGNRLNQGETYLDGLTDFQFYYALMKALNENYDWNNGAARLYYNLVDDVIYAHPENNVTFLDNHDLDRFFGSINRDYKKFELGYALLFTMRGIPSMQYGSEILMDMKGEHGAIRSDFPGGWQEDAINKFESEGRDSLENTAFNYIKRLANWRANCDAITSGALTQYIPENKSYSFIRHSENSAVLMIINQGDKDREYPLSHYEEILGSQRKYINVIDGTVNESESIFLKASEFILLEFDLL